VDHLTQKFPGGLENSRRFPGFPGAVDTLGLVSVDSTFAKKLNYMPKIH